MPDPSHLPALVLALALDALFGEPAWLYLRVPHPVVLAGRLIAGLDRRLNRDDLPPDQRRWNGIAALLALIAATVLPAWLLARLLHAIPNGWLAEAALASTLFAQRSLYDHVQAVARALDEGVAAGRQAVSRIVGRDPASLDAAGVARAAIESCAENFSDGIVAPALWFALLGLPGIVLYKAVNTADSMIGHLTPRHRAFGWAAARLDDLLNLPASRLAGLLIAGAGLFSGGRRAAAAALAAMRRDAGRHRSPNAGWPEAAMAGALGLALAGPRQYGGRVVEDAWMNPGGRSAATAGDVRRSLKLMALACLLQAAGLLMLAL